MKIALSLLKTGCGQGTLDIRSIFVFEAVDDTKRRKTYEIF